MINPRDPGLMKPVVESVVESPDYALVKAIELIREYRVNKKYTNLFMAITLLGLFLALAGAMNGPVQAKSLKKARSKDTGSDNQGTSVP